MQNRDVSNNGKSCKAWLDAHLNTQTVVCTTKQPHLKTTEIWWVNTRRKGRLLAIDRSIGPVSFGTISRITAKVLYVRDTTDWDAHLESDTCGRGQESKEPKAGTEKTRFGLHNTFRSEPNHKPCLPVHNCCLTVDTKQGLWVIVY